MSTNYFQIRKGLNLQPGASTVSVLGDVDFNSSSNQLEVYTTAVESLTSNSNTQTFTNKTISGTSNTLSNIANASLTNSSVTIGSTSVSLGATAATVAGLTLTTPVIAQINSGTGTFTLPTSGAITVPGATDTVALLAATQTLTNKTISGTTNTLSNIGNASLTNSSLTIGSTSVALGATATTVAGLTLSGATHTGTTTFPGTTSIDGSGNVTTTTLSSNGLITAKTGVQFTEITTPSSPPSGSVSIYPKANGLFYSLSSAGVETPLGTGGSGNKNYLSATTTSNGTNTGNGNFEFGNTTGWAIAHSSITNSIPSSTVTAGSPFNLTTSIGNIALAAITSGNIAGTTSGSITAAATSTAGDMIISSAFNIDTEDQAKMMTMRFSYKAVSGTFNFSGTSSNSFAVFVYDVTNGAWIQPQGVYNLTQSSGVGTFVGTFQTTSNSTQYQLALVNLNSITGAYSLTVDDFSVGPNAVAVGPAMTDWVAYTPTFVGFGTVTNILAYSRRVGDTLQVVASGTAGTMTSSVATMTIGYNGSSGNVSVDGTKVSNGGLVGDLTSTQYGTTFFRNTVQADTGATVVTFGAQDTSQAGTTPATGTQLFGGANSQSFSMFFQVPIVGWSSNTNMSADTDTRVIALNATPSTAGSMGNLGTSYTAVVFNTVSKDTAGAYNATNGTYTIPVTGFYDFSVAVQCGGTASSGATYNAYIQNLTASAVIAFNNFVCLAATSTTIAIPISIKSVYLTAGTQVNVVAQYAGTVSSPVYGTLSYLSIARQSGPAVITATESVNARYHATSTQSIPYGAGTAITNFTTKDYDSHGAFNPSTGVYTVPVSGKYSATIQVASNAAVSASAIANNLQVWVAHNGFQQAASFAFAPTTSSYYYVASCTDDFNCLAGDTLTATVYQTLVTSTALTVGTGVTGMYVTFKRVGN